MRGWALGLLHLSREQFYEMRIGEFWEAMDAYWEQVKADRVHIAELIRGETMMLVNLQLKKKDRYKHPSKFWPMPWDDDPEAENKAELARLNNLTDEERDREAKEFLKRIGDL